jgi:hypothetical protein
MRPLRSVAIFLYLLCALLTAQTAHCSDVSVSNISVGTPNQATGNVDVSFDISWTNSWRTSSAPYNWDAAWVFIKYRVNGGAWNHARLNETGHTIPGNAAITVGLADTNSAFDLSTNPAVGAFLFRRNEGAGTFTASGVSLNWNYASHGISVTDNLDVKVLAIEMIYVPQAPYYAGDNATSTAAFKQGSTDTDPWYIDREDELSTTNSVGNGSGSGQTERIFFNPATTDGDSDGAVYSLSADFPKGYHPYYVMKGPISQGQWVNFFNTLTPTQKSARDITATKGDSLAFRNNVSWTSGNATLPDQGDGATYAYVGMSYLSWGDLAAFLDWAGLRPMSELEFEKVARGPLSPVAGEYAWGSTTATQATSFSSSATGTERAQDGANVSYGDHASVQGPLRVGSFGYGVNTREASGAGFYGSMDLSGSLWDRVVTVGNAAGRSFNGAFHGNGSLNAGGDADVSSWPSTTAQGTGVRGGSWYDSASLARLSDRSRSALSDATRNNTAGGRGVRLAFGASIPAATPSATPTASPTVTPTETPTGTPTLTPTITPTSTWTSTPTVTPTNTSTETPTHTATQTPTTTPTWTPTVTPTRTNTPTPTVTPTPTNPPLYVTANLRGNWDAQYADGTQPYVSANTTWQDLTSNNNDGTVSSTANVSWTGNGSYASPYACTLNGQGSVDFGSGPLASQTKMMFTAWVKSNDVAVGGNGSDSIIIGNSANATGSGFTLRQHPSYRDVVLSMSPLRYWRLGESSGTTANDISGNGSHATYNSSGVTLGATGGLTNDTNTAATFDGNTGYASASDITGLNDFTVSFWAKYLGSNSGERTLFGADNYNSSPRYGLIVKPYGSTFGQPQYEAYINGTGGGLAFSATTTNWNHYLFVRSGTSLSLYLNGAYVSAITVGSGIAQLNNIRVGSHYFNGSAQEFSNSSVQDVAIFTSALTRGQIASLYQAGVTGRTADLVMGRSYQDVVLADSPISYWRLGTTSGNEVDISGNGHTLTYTSGTIRGASGAIAGDANTAATFGTLSTHCAQATVAETPSALSVEAWFYATADGITSTREIVERQSSGAPHYTQWNMSWKFNGTVNSLYARLGFTDGSNTDLQSGTLSKNAWHHAILTWSGTVAKLYVDGSEVASSTVGAKNITYNSQIFNIGCYSGGNESFIGNIDEVAIYNTALSAAQVATHYNAGLATYGGICRSTSSFADNLWNNIAGIFSGSSASLFVNGKQECTVSTSNGFTIPASNLYAGATNSNTKNFTGSIADVKVYGTSDGSAVGTSTDVKTNFDTTADRYRENAVGAIVTNGLVLNLDAANATRTGLTHYRNGCAASDLSWYDTSSSALTGTLTNFATCGSASGWTGDGTTTVSGNAGPYRLDLDGSNDFVTTGSYNSTITTKTLMAWVYIKSISSGSGAPVNIQTTDGNNFDAIVYNETNRGWGFGSDNWSRTAWSDVKETSVGWVHIAATYSDRDYKLYRNGTLILTSTAFGLRTFNSGTTNSLLGKRHGTCGGNCSLNGAIGSTQIYNRALSASEISQNCNAQKTRFNGALCN